MTGIAVARIAVTGIAMTGIAVTGIAMSEIAILFAVIMLGDGVAPVSAARSADGPRASGCAPPALVVIVRIAVTDVARRNPNFAARGRGFPPARRPLVVPILIVIEIEAADPDRTGEWRARSDLVARRRRAKIDTEMDLRECRNCKGQKARKHE